MASRFQRDSRNALFSGYDAQTRSRPSSAVRTSQPPTPSPYANGDLPARRSNDGGFRPATPDKKGQYSDAVLDELESQNEEQVGEMTKKVRMLKDITAAIGVEIRDSTVLAEKMNDGFESTQNALRGTMNRMLRMAKQTGIGWKVWLGFFVCVFLLFAYVWLR